MNKQERLEKTELLKSTSTGDELERVEKLELLSKQRPKSAINYSLRDFKILDYDVYNLNGFVLRGPKASTLKPKKYFVCIGAGQTFGCICKKPFPNILSKKLNLPVLNLGMGGAGPERFIKYYNQLHEHINNAKFAVIQVMSGRTAENELFESGGAHSVKLKSNGKNIETKVAYDDLIKNNDVNYVKKIIKETRENWIKNNKELFSMIKIPIVLLWYSYRKPDYKDDYSNVNKLLNQFPQMVNQPMVDEIRKHVDYYVETVSPMKYAKEFKHIPYYGTPKYHKDVANALEPICIKLKGQL